MQLWHRKAQIISCCHLILKYDFGSTWTNVTHGINTHLLGYSLRKVSCCGTASAAALYIYSLLKYAYGGSHIVCWVLALFVPTQLVPRLVRPM